MIGSYSLQLHCLCIFSRQLSEKTLYNRKFPLVDVHLDLSRPTGPSEPTKWGAMTTFITPYQSFGYENGMDIIWWRRPSHGTQSRALKIQLGVRFWARVAFSVFS